jgi:hypothetical protein
MTLTEVRNSRPRVAVGLPERYQPEREYIWKVLLEEGLGLETEFHLQAGAETLLSLPGTEGGITVPDGLFGLADNAWLMPRSLPQKPVARLRWPESSHFPPADDVVAIFGAKPGATEAIFHSGRKVEFNFDLAGSAFFMLSRYEEAVPSSTKDAHGRMPSGSMLAVTEGVYQRAIVNEYLLILEGCINMLWPGLVRSCRDYRVLLSHDVDSALSSAGAGWVETVRAVSGDLVRRRDPRLAARRFASKALRGTSYGREIDPYDTFDFLMSEAESKGIRGAYNFICGGVPRLDANYSMESPWIQALLRKVAERGHEVGLHPSYASADTDGVIANEFVHLKSAAGKAGISQPEWGGRHHYLRWNPSAWRQWDDAGLAYDSSLGYADLAGFRSGYCYEHTTFDLAGRRHLRLRERPLVVMEKTVFPDTFTDSSLDGMISTCVLLAAVCRKFGGDFTILWHNSKVASRHQVVAFREMMRVACLGGV